MKKWPELRDSNWLSRYLDSWSMARYWSHRFEKAYSGKIDTWDYHWTFSCWLQSGLTILPNLNLVQNIGFNSEATHTKVKNRFANITANEISFPLTDPPFFIRDNQADHYTNQLIYKTNLLFAIVFINEKFSASSEIIFKLSVLKFSESLITPVYCISNLLSISVINAKQLVYDDLNGFPNT